MYMFVLFYCNIGSTGTQPSGQETGGKPLFQSYLPNLVSCLPHMENQVSVLGIMYGLKPRLSGLFLLCKLSHLYLHPYLSHSTIVSCPYIVIKPLKHWSYSIIPPLSHVHYIVLHCLHTYILLFYSTST
jgi:hypothetical protein